MATGPQSASAYGDAHKDRLDFDEWRDLYGDEVEQHPLEHQPMWWPEYKLYCEEQDNERSGND